MNNLKSIIIENNLFKEKFKKYQNQYIFNISNPNNYFSDVLKILPPDYKPDVIILNSPEYGIIPVDIDYFNIPIVALIGDWNIAFETILYNLPRFDYVFIDRKGKSLFENIGYGNIEYFPLFSYDPNKFRIIENLEKIYDISFVGNMNHAIQYNRFSYLKRLTKLSNKYNVKIITNVFDDDYVKVLNQSKITFNKTIGGAMNMRCYEAPACGSLLFVEEDNLEIRDFLEDKKECIYYNDKNLEELLEYYLKNNQEREKIANLGYKKIQQFSYPNMFKKLISRIEGLLKSGKLTRKKTFITFSKDKQTKAIVNNVIRLSVLNESTINFVLETLKKQIIDSNNKDIESLNNLASIYINLLHEIKPELRQDIIKQTLNLLNLAIKENNEYVIAYYNLGYLYFSISEFEKSLDIFLKCVNLLTENYKKSLSIPGICFRKLYERFQIEWERGYFENLPDKDKVLKFHRDLLLTYIWEKIGDIYFSKKDIEKSIDSYKKSFNIRKDLSGSCFKLAQIYENINVDESIKYYEEATKNNPFDLNISLSFAKFLYKINYIDKCEEVCRENLLVIKTYDYLLDYKKEFIEILEDCINYYINKFIQGFNKNNSDEFNYYFQKYLNHIKQNNTNNFDNGIFCIYQRDYNKGIKILKELVKDIGLIEIYKLIGILNYCEKRELAYRIFFLIKENEILWKPNVSELEIINHAIKKGINQDMRTIIDMNKFSPNVLPLEIEGINEFNFLTICNWSKSKDKILELINSYVQYFSSYDQVCLLIKLLDTGNQECAMNEIGKELTNKEDIPDILIIQEEIVTENLASFISICNVYICLEVTPFLDFYSLCAGAMNKEVVSFEKFESTYFHSVKEKKDIGKLLNDIYANRNKDKNNLFYLYIKENHSKEAIREKLVDTLIKQEIYKILDSRLLFPTVFLR